MRCFFMFWNTVFYQNLPVYNGPSTDSPLPISHYSCALFSYFTVEIYIFSCCTVFMLHQLHVALFCVVIFSCTLSSCCTLFIYCSISCFTFTRCNVLVLHSAPVAIFACCNFFLQHFVHVVPHSCFNKNL